MTMLLPMLAEVSDKMMSWTMRWSWSFVIPVVAWGLIRKSKWLSIFPLLLSLLLAVGTIVAWCDPYIHVAVIKELGYLYLALGFVPLIATVMLLIVVRKRANQALLPTPTADTPAAAHPSRQP